MATKWAHLKSGKCIEVFWSGSRKAYIPIDARILEGNRTPEWESNQVFETQPPDRKISMVGDKLELQTEVVFDIRCVFMRHRSPIKSDATIYIDKDSLVDAIFESPMKGRAVIRSVKGYDGTHLCGYCEEYSTTNPTVNDICKGCDHSDWVEWKNKPSYKVYDELSAKVD